MSTDVVSDLVREAAEALDEVRPRWRAEVDLGTLDMDDGSTCLLGQVFGNYDEGIEELQAHGVEQRLLDTFESGYWQGAWEEVLEPE